jgi:hypothetical protein
MTTKTEHTFWAKIYVSGPIKSAKNIIRKSCLSKGLCVTIKPTLFIYTGGEESGYVVGLINYPRFPSDEASIESRAIELANELMTGTFQQSVLVMTPHQTTWLTTRD